MPVSLGSAQAIVIDSTILVVRLLCDVRFPTQIVQQVVDECPSSVELRSNSRRRVRAVEMTYTRA